MSTQLQFEAAARHPYLTTAGHDHLAWAKRILFREERNDKELTSIQIRFAHMAIDRKPEAS